MHRSGEAAACAPGGARGRAGGDGVPRKRRCREPRRLTEVCMQAADSRYDSSHITQGGPQPVCVRRGSYDCGRPFLCVSAKRAVPVTLVESWTAAPVINCHNRVS